MSKRWCELSIGFMEFHSNHVFKICYFKGKYPFLSEGLTEARGQFTFQTFKTGT